MTIQIPRLSVVPSADSHRKLATTVNQVLSTIATIVPQSTASLGAKVDGVTDDSTTIQTWADTGGWLYPSVGDSKSNQTTIIRKNVHIEGSGYGFDARIVGYGAMPGSRITYAAGVAGLDIQPQWTGLDWTNTTPMQEGAYNSVIENIGLIGSGGATANGIHLRTLAHLRNVTVEGFSGKGFDIAAGANPGNNGESGNADLSTFEYCSVIACGGDAFHSRGVDGNVLKFDSCNASGNSGWGFALEAEFPSVLMNCHATSNTLGSYKITSGTIACHVLLACYDEGGAGANCDLSAPTVIVGGTLAQTAALAANNAHSAGAMPTIIDGTGYSTFGALHINWNNFDSAGPGHVLSTDAGSISGSSLYGLVFQAGTINNISFFDNAGLQLAILYGADKSFHPQGSVNIDDATKAFLINGVQVVGSSHPNHFKAATSSATYVAPSGGTTIDTQARASLAQLAADLADMKAKFQAAVLMT